MKNDKTDKKNDQEEIKETKGAEETKKIEELLQKVADFENRYKRVLADYQNLEKRSIEDRRGWIKLANKDLLLRMLPVLDTLVLASSHTQDQGLKISVAQFLDILKAEGVTKIETIGNEFDPAVMECVETVDPSTGSGQEGKVLKELRSGYRLYDKVLRPAQVIVGKAKMSS